MYSGSLDPIQSWLSEARTRYPHLGCNALATVSGTVVEVRFGNLAPGAGAPLAPPASALGLEVSAGAGAAATWTNATFARLGSARGTLQIGSAVAGARQVRYLWADNPCFGWNSTTERPETGQYRCPLRTSSPAAGLPVLPFLLDVTSAASSGAAAGPAAAPDPGWV